MQTNGFTGSEQGLENRYIQLGARTYDPTMGRFLSVDPMFEAYPGLTPYHYCANSPLTNVDPSGMTMETMVFEDCLIEENIEGVVKQGIDPLDPEPDPEKPRGGGGSGGGTARAYTEPSGITERVAEPMVIDDKGSGSKNLGNSQYGINGPSLDDFGKTLAPALVDNFAQMTSSQQVAVNNALNIIFDNGGDGVLISLLQNNVKLHLNFDYNSEQLAKMWNKFSYFIGENLAGLTKQCWPDKCIDGTSQDNKNFILGSTYIASELLLGKPVTGYNYTYFYPDGTIFGLKSVGKDNFCFGMVLEHELKHIFDSYNCSSPMNSDQREKSADDFMIFIWDNVQRSNGFKFKERFK